MFKVSNDLIFEYSHLIIDYNSPPRRYARVVPYNTLHQYANLAMIISLAASRKAIQSYKRLAGKYTQTDDNEAKEVLAAMNEAKLNWRQALDNYKKASVAFNANCHGANSQTKRASLLNLC